jgi:hypothetical protein
LYIGRRNHYQRRGIVGYRALAVTNLLDFLKPVRGLLPNALLSL